MFMRPFQVLICASLLWSSCNFRDEKTPGEDDTASTPITEAQLNFAEVKSQVLTPYCLNCHSAAGGSQGGIGLETYAQVSARLAAVERTALVQKRMPPTGDLSASASELLQKWIDAGAPELAP